MTRPKFGFREWVFSLNSFAAALSALYLSLLSDLEYPYWAMMSAYIASQPFSGAVRSKAVFRLIGTVLGATMTVFLFPIFVNTPALLSLALSCWIGLCLFFSLLDRTPRSYVFMLAGYTTTFVGLTVVDRPEVIFDFAVARVEEIGIGVLCAAFFHSLFFPRQISETLKAKARTSMDDLTRWIADALHHETPAVILADRHKLLRDMTDLRLMAGHIPYDTHEPRQKQELLTALQDQMILLFPVIVTLSDRIARLDKRDALNNQTLALLARTRAWLDLPLDRMARDKADLLAACDHCQRHQAKTWSGLLRGNLARRLVEMIEIVFVCRELSDRLAGHDVVLSPGARRALRARLSRPLHKEYASALRSALVSAGVLFMGFLIWIGTAWEYGGYAIMMASVTCSLFAAMPNPIPAQQVFFRYTFLASIAAGIYLFAVFPHVHSLPTLALTLAPFLLPAGAAMAVPDLYGKMLPLIVPFCGNLIITNTKTPDFLLWANMNIAYLIGIASIVYATRAFYDLDGRKKVAGILRTMWDELADVAEGSRRLVIADWSGLMVDRIGMIVPLKSALPKDDQNTETTRALRSGLNLIALQRLKAALDKPRAASLDRLLTAMSDHYRLRARGFARTTPVELLAALEAEIERARDYDRGPVTDDLLNALIGLRCSLSPLTAPVAEAQKGAFYD
ncbi:hypothetical protein CCR80_04755 [Rhodothalassium salexigens]|uniref:FUSC family protein n=1 Tax=Rhodothalassium salexigens TaxID=1086 RepID=UPI001913E437|nr:FUSC family protein [Rhodothalassium salexigens]MBK5920350.1 hypothetical protein [Rhodothalassium salexigens]